MSMPVIIALCVGVFSAVAYFVAGFCINYHRLSKQNEAKLAIRIGAYRKAYVAAKVRHTHEILDGGLFAPFSQSRDAFCRARNNFRVGKTRVARQDIELAYKYLKQAALTAAELDCNAESLAMLEGSLTGITD